jgi:putative transcriptional regulator
MSEKDTIVRVTVDVDNPADGGTDWERVDAMTEEELHANAVADPDNPPMDAKELAAMRPVPNPRAIREALSLSQSEFAARFDIPLGTVQDWDQGRRRLDRSTQALLRVIQYAPKIVEEAVKLSRSAGEPAADSHAENRHA